MCPRLPLARVRSGGFAEPRTPVGKHGGNHQRCGHRFRWIVRAIQQVQNGHRSTVGTTHWLLVTDIYLTKAEVFEGDSAFPRIGAGPMLAPEIGW